MHPRDDFFPHQVDVLEGFTLGHLGIEQPQDDIGESHVLVFLNLLQALFRAAQNKCFCLLYTSDAADE